ncbi:hypothetical protein LPJ66_012266, partial [Kickxella alabastrina]
MLCFATTIAIIAAMTAFIAPAANASPVSASYQPTKNTCSSGNAYPYNAGYNNNAYPYGGAYDAYNSYGG